VRSADPTATPERPDLEGHIMTSTTPRPVNRPRLSVLLGSVGAVIAILSTLIVSNLFSTLTGSEEDLGVGLVAIAIGFVALVAVACLGIAAISIGILGMRAATHTGTSPQALVGVLLGACDLLAAIAAAFSIAAT